MQLTERQIQLKEKALTADEIFSGWLDPVKLAEVKAKFEDKAKTHKGQLEILKAAADHDMDAAMYLYDRYKLLTLRHFWKYYIGKNKELGMQKIYNEAAVDLAEKSLELLSGNNKPNPFESWDASRYLDDLDTDLIKQFSYWYGRYFQNECVKAWTKEKKGGLTGNQSSEEPASIGSYDELTDKELESSEGYSLGADEEAEKKENQLILINTIKDFKKWLRDNKPERELAVFDLKLQGLKNKEIAKELKFSNDQIVTDIWTKLKKYWIEKYPETASLLG